MGAPSWLSPFSSGSAGLEEEEGEGPLSLSGLSQRKAVFLRSDPPDFDQEAVAGLSQPRRVFSHLISEVRKTCAEAAERRSEIRESWVVLTVPD